MVHDSALRVGRYAVAGCKAEAHDKAKGLSRADRIYGEPKEKKEE